MFNKLVTNKPGARTAFTAAPGNVTQGYGTADGLTFFSKTTVGPPFVERYVTVARHGWTFTPRASMP